MKPLLDILYGRFPKGEYEIMAEVSDHITMRNRSADYIVTGMFPSRGLTITGIEVKSHRSDWLLEKKNPKKAENIFRFCDYFYLLTTSDGIATLEEIPQPWGWLSVKGDRIFTMKKAPQLQPEPLSRPFIFSMLRRANDKKNYVHKESIEDAIKQRAEEVRGISQTRIDRLQEEKRDLQKRILDFESCSGIKVGANLTWDMSSPEKVGKAVRFILDGGIEQSREDLQRLADSANRIATNLNEILSIPSITTTNDQHPAQLPSVQVLQENNGSNELTPAREQD